MCPEPCSSMNIVPLMPTGLPANAGYSFAAVSRSLKKISIGPLTTDPKTNGDCSGTVNPALEPEDVRVERQAALDVGDQKIGRELGECSHGTPFRVLALPTSVNSARTRSQVGTALWAGAVPLGTAGTITQVE